MKKLLVILFSAALCVSCTQVHRAESGEPSDLKSSKCTYTSIGGATIKIKKINYSGHSYILVNSTQYEGSGVSVVHDPDCPCGKGK